MVFHCLCASNLGADEVNAIVLDVGTCLCKAGYGGDDVPKAIFPSVSSMGRTSRWQYELQFQSSTLHRGICCAMCNSRVALDELLLPSWQQNVLVVAADPWAVRLSCLTQNVGYRNPDSNGMEVDGQPAGKRELFVGQSALNYRRDNMEVRACRGQRREVITCGRCDRHTGRERQQQIFGCGLICHAQLALEACKPVHPTWPPYCASIDAAQVTSPFNEDGILSDWDATEALWDHAFK